MQRIRQQQPNRQMKRQRFECAEEEEKEVLEEDGLMGEGVGIVLQGIPGSNGEVAGFQDVCGQWYRR